MAIPQKLQVIKNLATFTAIVALGNLAVAIWHLRLAGKLNPDLTYATAARIGALTTVFTLVGIILLWAKRRIIGSLVLVAVFGVGLVVGSLEHFFIAGPNNVFDVGLGVVALLFRVNVALLVAFEIAGLWGAGTLIKSAWRPAV